MSSVPVRVRVHPAELAGTVRVPGDKSLSHRALILGALVGEPVAVSGVAPSGDVSSTARALRTMGAAVDLAPGEHGLSGSVCGPLREPSDVVDCGNSGTSLRLLAGVAAGVEGVSVLTGDASLRRRPVDRVRLPLEALGARIDAREGGRLPPLVIRGGGLRGTDHDSPVASAQVKSCVLLAGLAAQGTTRVTSPLPSRDHTERLLRHLGRDVETVLGADGSERVTLGEGRLRARPLQVPADPSSAAFWWVAAAVGARDAAITAADVCLNPGRTGVLVVLAELGAAIERTHQRDVAGEPVADVRVTGSALGTAVVAGRTIVDALDELPVLALAGAVSSGGLTVRDAAELRVKESDRIDATARALGALGIEVHTAPDGFHVPGGQRPTAGTVHAEHDHRIAMLGAVAATIADGPVEITGFDSVATSYPSFLDDLAALGGRSEVLEAQETSP